MRTLARHAAHLIASTALLAGVAAVVQLGPATADDSPPIPRDPVLTGMPAKGRMLFVPSLPCKYEDGPGPCFWDAGRRGNGRGASYVVTDRGRVIYLDLRVAR